MGMKVLVTGGAGFIGCATVAELVMCGYDVVVLDSLEPQVHGLAGMVPSGLKPLISSGSVEFVKGRVEDEGLLLPLLQRCNLIVHLAALVGVGQSTYEARRYTIGNAVATSALVEAIVQGKTVVERVVAASSISNYGEGCGWNPRTLCAVAPVRFRNHIIAKRWEPVDPADELPVSAIPTPEDFPLRPTSMYGLTKLYTEGGIRLLGEATGMPVAILRYGNVYGPGQALSNPYTGVLCNFYTRLRSRAMPLVFEDGRQMRRYIHVRDVARANTQALDSNITGTVCVNISSPEDVALIDVANAIADGLGTDVRPRVLGVARVGDVRHMLPNVTLAETQIGFKSQIGFADGLRNWLDTIAKETPQDRSRDALRHLMQHGLLIGSIPDDLMDWLDCEVA